MGAQRTIEPHWALRKIDAAEIADALPFTDLIDHYAVSLQRPAAVPLRLGVSSGTGRELLVMPAMTDRYAGVKVLTVTEDNGLNGLPVISGLFVLIDARTGEMLAIFDAAELTARRTAAISALAARALARPDAQRLCMLGTGHLAPYLAEAHAKVRPIDTIDVWGRSADKAAKTAADIQRRLPNIAVRVVDDLPTAIARADVISSATRATEPLIHGAWVRPGTHVDLVGGYRPDMREIDDRGVLQSAIYVDTVEGALAEAGDLRTPIEKGAIGADAIRGDITTLAGSEQILPAGTRTLFKSVGTALADLAAAELVWEKLDAS